MRSVDEELLRAMVFGQRAQDLIVARESVTVGPAGGRDKLLLALWSVTFDLDKGICALISHKFYSGAFALVRPLVEALIRAHVVVMGSDDEIRQLENDTYNVNFNTVGEVIDAKFGYHGVFARFLKRAVAAMHSFAHSGLSQLARHFKDGAVGANYGDAEIIEVVHTSTTVVCYVSLLVATQFKLRDEWKVIEQLFIEWGQPH